MAAEDLSKNTMRGGRKKLPMQLIKDANKRHVSFCKRKRGLFGKCAALCTLFSGAAVDVAVVVFSQKGKLFSFGHSSTDSVLRRFLSLHGGNSGSDDSIASDAGGSGSGEAAAAAAVVSSWENANVEEMSCEELMVLKSSLEEMKKRAFDNIEKLGFGHSEINKSIVVESQSVDIDLSGDFLSLDDLGFECGSDNQQQSKVLSGDGGLMDIFYDFQQRRQSSMMIK